MTVIGQEWARRERINIEAVTMLKPYLRGKYKSQSLQSAFTKGWKLLHCFIKERKCTLCRNTIHRYVYERIYLYWRVVCMCDMCIILCMCVGVICGRKFVCSYKCASTCLERLPRHLISKLQMVVFPSWLYTRSFQAERFKACFHVIT